MIRFCAHPDCINIIPEDKLRENPDRVYCSSECYHSDPAVHARLRRLNQAQWDMDYDGVVERLHAPKATAKRSVAIAKSNHDKPRRKPKQRGGPGD